GQGNVNSGVRDAVAHKLEKNGYLKEGVAHSDKEVAAAVRKYQEENQLKPDGIVGRNTWRSLKEDQTEIVNKKAESNPEGANKSVDHSSVVGKQANSISQGQAQPGELQSGAKQDNDVPVIRGKTDVEVKTSLGVVTQSSTVVTPGMALGKTVNVKHESAIVTENVQEKSEKVVDSQKPSSGTVITDNRSIEPMTINGEIWNRNSSTAHMGVNRKMVIDSVTANDLLPPKPTSGYSNKEIEDAVKEFQGKAGFNKTGVVDLVTMDRMRNSADLNEGIITKVLNKLW
ncbi:MAG: peptidoglycan-binding domain-containing protein, partial [bacterium]|nr:peptidoglycan-binding domain-containing protein [bacterium]